MQKYTIIIQDFLKSAKNRHTPAAVSDQQHTAVFAAADLLDDIEVLFNLKATQALCRELHQLVYGAAAVLHRAQLDHLSACQQYTRKLTLLDMN